MKGSAKDFQSLKDALHDTIHRHQTKSVRAMADEMGMAESYLYRSALPDQDTGGDGASGVRFPLKMLIPLIRTSGNFAVLDYIEHTLGRVAIPLPKVSSELSEISRKAIRSAREFGELMAECDRSIADGTITKEEAKRIEQEGYGALQAISVLVEAAILAAK